MMNLSPTITIELPPWLQKRLVEPLPPLDTLAKRMQWVIDLARANMAEKSGGPFAAAIFDAQQNALVAAGVNLVLAANCSLLHAEVTAIMLAQHRLGTWDLGGESMPFCELVTIAEPCTMCQGAVLWSGVRRLIYAARDEDVRAIGFDEGPKMDRWQAALRQRGIEVVADFDRKAAIEVLQSYAAGNGVIYNARGTGK